MADSGSDSEPEPTVADQLVLAKYVAAGKIANCKYVLLLCVAVAVLCYIYFCVFNLLRL